MLATGKKCFFSVVTVCYKNLDDLKHTYCSLKLQSEQSFEWLVIDGSECEEILNWFNSEVANSGLRAKLKSKKDGGIYDGMNAGTNLANGKWLIYMNSGDCFSSNTVLESVKEASLDGVYSFIYGNAAEVFPNGERQMKVSGNPGRIFWGMFAHHQAMFFNVELFKISYNVDYRIAADFELVARVYNSFPESHIKKIDVDICDFSIGGASMQSHNLGRKEAFDIRRKILGQGVFIASIIYIFQVIIFKSKMLFPSLYRWARYK